MPDCVVTHDFLTQARDNTHIREAGFESFNVDLMCGFPLRAGHKDKWSDTVQSTIGQIDPDHLTLYRRYKGTKMAHLQERVGLQQVNEQSDAAARILAEQGFARWTGKTRSASSQMIPAARTIWKSGWKPRGRPVVQPQHAELQPRWGNQAHGAVHEKPRTRPHTGAGFVPPSSVEGATGKFCSVSFYFGGINRVHFSDVFGQALEDAFPTQVAFALGEGLMEDTSDSERVQMTQKTAAWRRSVPLLCAAHPRTVA